MEDFNKNALSESNFRRGTAFWYKFEYERGTSERPALIASADELNAELEGITVWTGTGHATPFGVKQKPFPIAQRKSLQRGEGYFKPFDLVTLPKHDYHHPITHNLLLRGLSSSSCEGRCSEDSVLLEMSRRLELVLFGGDFTPDIDLHLLKRARDKRPIFRDLLPGHIVDVQHKGSLQASRFLVVSHQDFHRCHPFETFVALPVDRVPAGMTQRPNALHLRLPADIRGDIEFRIAIRPRSFTGTSRDRDNRWYEWSNVRHIGEPPFKIGDTMLENVLDSLREYFDLGDSQ